MPIVAGVNPVTDPLRDDNRTLPLEIGWACGFEKITLILFRLKG